MAALSIPAWYDDNLLNIFVARIIACCDVRVGR